MTCRRALLAALASLVAMTDHAGAQSLQVLHEAARSYDAGYLGARALADSAQFRVDQVHALRRPNLGLSVNGARSVGDAPVSSTRNRAVTGTLSAVQPLFNRVNDATIAQADRSLDAAAADLELAEQDLIVRLAQSYFDVLGALDSLETTRANKRAIAQQRAAAQRNYEVGTATITDVREAQARYDLATAQDLSADNDLTLRRIALDELVGRRAVEPWRLLASMPLPQLAPNAVDDWVAATDTSPTVRRAIVVSDIAKLETDKSRAQDLPTVELNGSYAVGTGRLVGTQSLTSSGEAIDSAIPIDVHGRTINASVGVLVRVPLFAGFAIQDRIKETLRLEDQARYALEAARRGTAQATRQAFFGVQSLAAQAVALHAAVTSSQSALDATLVGYRVGVRVNIDVLNAQSQLYTTQRDLAQARYGVLLNRLKLRQAAGSLSGDDLAAVNGLLSPVTGADSARDVAGLIPSRMTAGVGNAPRAVLETVNANANVIGNSNPTLIAATLEQPFADAVANAFLARWTHAWTRRDVDAYVALYEPAFTGLEGSHDAWQARRRAHIEGKRTIEVGVTSRVVTPGPGSVVLDFEQTYRGDDLRQTSRKRITLRRHGAGWKVAEEVERP